MAHNWGRKERRSDERNAEGPAARQPRRAELGKAAPTLAETLMLASQAAWKGESAAARFDRDLEFATCGGSSLVFLSGEYVGEVSLHERQLALSQPSSLLTVYREFNPKHQLYFISDPRKYAPGFAQDLGLFPSRDTTAVALLQALHRRGVLDRFDKHWLQEGGPLRWLTFSPASLARPWLRLSYDGLELGWVMVDRDPDSRRTSWSFIGPPALGDRRQRRLFATREDAAIGLVAEIAKAYSTHPEAFRAGPSPEGQGQRAWNVAAVHLLRRLRESGVVLDPARRRAG